MAPLLTYLSLALFAFSEARPQQSAPSSITSASPSPSTSATADSLTEDEQEELFDLHEKLVDIPSISGEEAEVAKFVEEYLTELGYYVETVEVEEGRNNVFAYPQALKGEGKWPETLVTSHLDTVGPHISFERREKNGTMYHYGRGTVDAKGCVAAGIVAAHKFIESRDDTPSLGLLFVVGEETGGDGMKAFAEYAQNSTFRAGIFGEPTEGNLAEAHKGSYRFTLQADGVAAHSAYPHLGVSALNWLVEAIVALNKGEEALPWSDLLGNSTLNFGVMNAGVAANVVPESANASAAIRIANGTTEDIEEILTRAVQPVIDRAESAGANLTITFADVGYGAQILDTDVPGLDKAVMAYGTDIPSLPQVEKRYLYGTGSIHTAHSIREELSQDQLVQMADAYGVILAHLF
ncbi:Zn-dependent exopeptidase, partial [Sporormia fimetaria CBS 119925]